MSKSMQLAAIGVGAIAIIGLTYWNVSADALRLKAGMPENGIVFTGMQGDHSMHSNMADNQDVSVYLNKQDAIMAEMTKNMESVDESGNASVDFLTGMIPHHEAAVAMAELYLRSNGKSRALEGLATDIIRSQTKEIAQMKAALERIKRAGQQDTAKEAEYLKSYRQMLRGHHTGHGASGDTVDAAFAEGMIMHHQMAVDMANGILPYTDDEEVRSMAQSMIAVQEKEIRQMRESLTGR